MRYQEPERMRQPWILEEDIVEEEEEGAAEEEGVDMRRTRRWPLPEKGVAVAVGEDVLDERTEV